MQKQNIYIGNCSKKGIYHYKLWHGKLFFCGSTNDNERCTYLTKNKKVIYGVLEVKNKKDNNNGYIVSYKEKNGKLINIDKKISYGQGPCHIYVNSKRKLIFVSNYIDGSFSILRMKENGFIGKKIYNNILDKKKSHMHFSQMSNDNFFLYAVDIGTDTILVFEIIEDKIKEVTRINLGENIEPRHLVIDKNLIYVITEKSCRLYTLKFQNRKLIIINCQSILPSNIELKENYTGCAIKLSKNRRYIYISIRGHNSISVLKRDKQKIKFIQNIKCYGETPRDIELSKKDKYFLVANQESNDVSIFKRNRVTGKLKYINKEKMESPTCIIAK